MVRLGNSELNVQINPQGGCLMAATFCGKPFLKPAPVGCFPLVPFGNRVAGNQFRFRNQTHVLKPNTKDDPLYLHGDGWLAPWLVVEESQTHVRLAYEHQASHQSPYSYRAVQIVSINGNTLNLGLSVENRGEIALPFGLGFHPFFPRTQQTRLRAPATLFWSEKTGHLPDTAGPVPDDLNFAAFNHLPDRWVNNAFAGWNGTAQIAWPEARMTAAISGDPLFSHYMIYAPEDRKDFFCFEPMSHLPNGHNLPELGNLTTLEPGDKLSGGITLRIDEMRD
ncbi:aldose 1-epimerase [Phyllobacterium sp. TAF24]|uniref:aldose 1-epimerase n=1 Tax=Phyllobacterium sp. TAF24 TaxID=3233068 RepID=UPI003F950258